MVCVYEVFHPNIIITFINTFFPNKYYFESFFYEYKMTNPKQGEKKFNKRGTHKETLTGKDRKS